MLTFWKLRTLSIEASCIGLLLFSYSNKLSASEIENQSAPPKPADIVGDQINGSQAAKVRSSPHDRLVSIDFPEMTDIQDIAKDVGRWANKNFVWDSNTKGKIRIIAPKKIPIDEAYRIFLSALEMIGLSTIENGKIVKIEKTSRASKGATRIFHAGDQLPKSDELVTLVKPLKYIDAKWAVASLAKISSPRSLIAIESVNSLIMISNANKISRLNKLIEFLDVKSHQAKLNFIPVHNASPVEIKKKIEQFTKTASAGRKTTNNTYSIVAFEDLNIIAVLARPELTKRIRGFIQAVDLPTNEAGSEARFHIRHLDFSSAKQLSGVLNSMLDKQPRSSPKDESPKAKVVADVENNAIIVVGTFAQFKLIDSMIRKLDKRKAQVLIQAEILELSDSHQFIAGSAILGGAEGSTNIITAWEAKDIAPLVVASSNIQSSGAEREQIASSLSRDGANVGVLSGQGIQVPGLGTVSPAAFLQFLKSDSNTKTLSSPYLLSLENEEASLTVGEVLYFRSVDQNDSGGNPGQVSKENIDLELTLRAKVNNKNIVELLLVLESNQLTGFSLGLPQIGKRSMRQAVSLKSGQTALVSGVKSSMESTSTKKVPFLGSLPFFGQLFRYQRKQAKIRQLAIFLTLDIIKKSEDLMRISERKKTKL